MRILHLNFPHFRSQFAVDDLEKSKSILLISLAFALGVVCSPFKRDRIHRISSFTYDEINLSILSMFNIQRVCTYMCTQSTTVMDVIGCDYRLSINWNTYWNYYGIMFNAQFITFQFVLGKKPQFATNDYAG